ncbi:MAG: flagellar hook protein FlgE [Gammaproteobacteria bacterium]
MTFRTAISGLRATQSDLNVIGNNIANVGTTGFKASRAEFQDVFATTNVGVSATATGSGVNAARVAQQFTQGNITFTDSGLDLAISGQGFFIVDDEGARLFTRDGAFGVDREGFVVNSNDQRLVAFEVDDTGAVTGSTAPLRISSANTQPQATTEIELGANLDSQAVIPLVAPFDATDNNTFNNTTATSIFDSLGGTHLMQYYFVKTGSGTWNVHAFVDGTAVGAATPLAFGTNGALTTPVGGTATFGPFTPSGGGAAMSVDIDFTEMTQYGAPFGVNRLTQDGFTTGRLAGIDIDKNGNVFARYTNGQAELQGQVALANFSNPQGLQSLGKNNWAETFAAGSPLIGAPGSSSMGLIQAGALEDSNVDVSEMLVKLIVAQRNFQANTEVIQTADAVTQAVMNIR